MNDTSYVPEEGQAAEDEISLLDVLVTIAEHWLLLLLLPLLAGLAVFGFMSQQPETWRSSATVEVPLAEVSRHIRSAFNDGVAFAGIDVPILDIERGLTISADRTGEQTRIELMLADASTVQHALGAVLVPLYVSIETEMEALEHDIVHRERMIGTLQQMMEAPETGEGPDVAAYALAASTLNEIMSARDEQQTHRTQLAGRLAVLSEQAASPAARVGQAPLMIALMAFLATGFALLVLVFIRTGWKSAAADPETRSKIDRIRRAFWLAPRNS